MNKPFDIKYSALRRAIIERDFAHLNPGQFEAVTTVTGPVLVLAGAGSGKTTALISRIINLIEYGRGYEETSAPPDATEDDLRFMASYLAEKKAEDTSRAGKLCAVDAPMPWEIIAITFTNKAAGEMKARLLHALPAMAGDIWAHTFHSACTRILRRDIERIGYAPSFTIYDDMDSKHLMTSVIQDLGYETKKFDERGVLKEISRAKDRLLGPGKYAELAGEDFYKKKVALFYKEYQKRLLSANAVDFDDIIMKTVELFYECEDVLSYYQKKFRYVLVDEYQDTNYAQYVLASLLAGENENICVVGDDDQSIYKFRGATIENILKFESRYKNAKVIRLEQNYRSTKSILSVANGIIDHNVNRCGKKLWTDNADGQKIVIDVSENQETEAEYIAGRILDEYSKGRPFRDFTILYRNHVLSNNIEIAFKRNAIPYRIVSGLRFFDRAEIKDMLAYLCVLANPKDDLRLKRIINVPARKIGSKAVETAEHLAAREGKSLYEVIAHAGEYPELSRSAGQMGAFCVMMGSLMDKKETLPLDALYDTLLNESRYTEMLLQKEAEGQSRIENINELKSSILDYLARAENPSLSGFLEEISLFTDIDRYDQEADAVTMMTMHAAKGLEFSVVFICGMEDGVFPSKMSLETQEQVEEERRLCYVAVTRAREKLFLTAAQKRRIFGQTHFGKPSRFLTEAPVALLDGVIPSYSAIEDRTREDVANTRRADAAAAHPYPRQRKGGARAAPAKKIVQHFDKGDTIVHRTFGRGVVTNAVPMAGDLLVEVAFVDGATKRFLANSASQYISKV